MLNGATVLDWIARILGEPDIGALIDRVAARFTGPSPVIFLPYLSGGTHAPQRRRRPRRFLWTRRLGRAG